MNRLFKVFALVCALAAICFGQAAQTSTPNLGFQLPGRGQLNWNTPVNSNFTLIDGLLGGQQSMPPAFWTKMNADLALIPVAAEYGSFTDTGHLANWNVPIQELVGAGTFFTDVWIGAANPCGQLSCVIAWANCSSAPQVTVLDDLGNTVFTFSASPSIRVGGQTLYTYMAGGKYAAPGGMPISSGASYLTAVYTSPSGCTSLPTAVKIHIHAVVATATISPVTASVVQSATATFYGTASIPGVGDIAQNWSVDGIAGGNATVGTITANCPTGSSVCTATYSAPSSPGTHTVTVSAATSTATTASATVTVTGS